jgi:hypothetical protein
MTDQPRWGLHEDRRYELDTFINLLYGLALDQYGEMLTKSELGHVCVDTIDMTGSGDCAWCGVGAWELGEDFYVHDALWERYGPARGVLCIGCLERIMGRRLTLDDFTGYCCVVCSSNGVPREEWREKCPHMSDRLRDRLGIVPLPFAVNGEH